MEKRRLGKTGQMVGVLAFGGAAFWNISQGEADEAIDKYVGLGVNHFDVSPMYGQAEVRLGPWMEKHRKDIFLACKTTERSKTRAWESLKRSLDTLRVDGCNLFQFHGVQDIETMNAVLSPKGALEMALEARQQGLLQYIGITGHRPFVLMEALNRFDFDTVLFPLNRVLAARRDDYNDFTGLVELAREKDVGTIIIKAVTKRPWQAIPIYTTWYEPFDQQEDIDRSVWYALSQDITTYAMASDLRLWPMIVDAAERFKPLDAQEQETVVREVREYKPLFSSV